MNPNGSVKESFKIFHQTERRKKFTQIKPVHWEKRIYFYEKYKRLFNTHQVITTLIVLYEYLHLTDFGEKSVDGKK